MDQEKFSEVVIDIETVADLPPDLHRKMAAKLRAPSNWKDPEKIKKKIAQLEEEMVDKAALSPKTGRIVAVGVAVRSLESSEWNYHVLTDQTQDEPKLLLALDEVMYTVSPVRVIHFYGRKFDIPFLVARSMKYGLKLAYPWPVGRHPRSVDMYEVFQDGGLEDWALAILGKGKSGHGSEVGELVKEEKWDELAAYCRDDLELTASLYDRYREVVQIGGK